MKKYAVIVAGGSGLRMGTAIPKQFLLLNEKPLIYYTIQAFFSSSSDFKIILVLPQDYLREGHDLVKTFKAPEQITITVGGVNRFDSVKKGLALIKEPAIVFVHDGVRCLVGKDLINRCFTQALEKGSAIPAVAATDSIRISDGTDNSVIDRNKIRIVQTPQTFRSDILIPAFDQEYKNTFTDEATVVESAGERVHLIEGEYNNIKITRPFDLLIAQQILASRKKSEPGVL